ncbi:putative HNH nuclease domain-containing protein [Candidatus Magnetomoraceae bacterium gMMP-13]
MIPLTKTKEDIENYENWYQKNRDELANHFEAYLKKQKSDWIKIKYREDIQSFLFGTSHEKCAYCERNPNDGGGYLEIEHFYPKKIYKDLAFNFKNLLPSCKQCNTAKGQKYKDEEDNEIINPYCEKNMSVHLALNLENMQINGISKNGKASVSILNKSLNTNRTLQDGKIARGAVYKRIQIQERINKKLKLSENHKENKEVIFDELKDLLKLIDEKKTCTSVYSTVILQHPVFNELVEYIHINYESKYNILTSLIEKARQFTLHSNKSKK